MDKGSEFHVSVTRGGVVSHWVVIDTTLTKVKGEATKLKAELVEITDRAEGVVWTRRITDTRWKRVVPTRQSPTTLEDIRARMALITVEYAELYTKLDVFREKCPTCSCKIIPGETCECCAGKEMLTRIIGNLPVRATDHAEPSTRNLNTKLN